MSTWNKKNFSIYTSDERSALGLIEELGNQTNYNTQELEKVKESDNKKVSHDEMSSIYKIDKNADFTGSWHGIKKPTASQEGLQATVDKIVEEDIPSINEQLDNIEKQQLPLINQFAPYNNYSNNSKPSFSSSFSVGDSSFRPLYSEIDNNIKELSYCKPRGIVFCYHMIIESGIVKIVQLDKTDMQHSEERVDYALEKLKENNFFIRAIKIHTEFDSNSIDLTTNFWSSFQSCVNRLLNKHNDVDLFYLLNEVPTITRNPSYVTNIRNVINTIKNKGKKVSISNMGVSELKNNLYNNDVDILSVNLYPFMSVNGINTNEIECLGSWENAINELYEVVKTYNKDVIISETGCLDKEESLQAPGDYSVSGIECNGQIKRIFYNGLFKYFEKSFISEIFLWDGGSYSPYKNDNCLEVLRNNLGGNYNG